MSSEKDTIYPKNPKLREIMYLINQKKNYQLT